MFVVRDSFPSVAMMVSPTSSFVVSDSGKHTTFWRAPTEPRDLVQTVLRRSSNLCFALLSSNASLSLSRRLFAICHGEQSQNRQLALRG